MRRFAPALALLPLLPVPAAAEGERVTVSYLVHGVRVGLGDLVVALCEATAHAGTSGSTVTSTTVTCSVNNSPPETRTLPASKSYVVATNATVRPFVLCYSAAATFANEAGSHVVSTGTTCVPTA